MNLKPRRGLNPIHQSSLIKVAGRYIGIVTPQLYLILVLSIWMAQDMWQRNFETLTAIEAQQAQQREIKLEREPLTHEALEQLQVRLARMAPKSVPALVDSTDGRALKISIQKPEDLPVFREALLVILSSEEGTIWTPVEFCVGACQGSAAFASTTGSRQRIEVK